jgi:hypothetical protein
MRKYCACAWYICHRILHTKRGVWSFLASSVASRRQQHGSVAMPPNLRIGLVQSAPNQSYYPGSTITGSLLLDVDEPKSFNQILIQFSGRSYVHWTESRTEGSGDNQRTVTYTYSSTEPYVDLVAPLWNSQQSPDGKLPPGQYNWPFSFNLPPTAPSSFEGSVGNIRYSLVGKIVTGLLKFNHVVELRIPVQQLVKITDPRLLQPVRQEVQKRICCLCCASGPIVMTVAVPKTGFCIGEPFQLHTSLENGSSRRLTINATITQRVVYYAQGHTRLGGKALLNIASDEIEPRDTRNWDPTITIPTEGVDTIHETSCRNIKVTYTLNVVCRIPRAFNLSLAFPIQLGNCRDEQQTAPAGPPQQPAAVYPPAFQPAGPPSLPPNQPSAAYLPPVSTPGASAPPPYPGLPGANIATGPLTGANVGWSTEPLSDFPPPQPQETLSDFSAAQIQKGLK